ncbi:MAG: glyoxylate/hydroxypyruvate reductase A [Alphaproteobacteria bacterium]|nr:MAG: glyoxylate/hydroxypyruvate reductase A [Alphaproteobacteria bacterium]
MTSVERGRVLLAVTGWDPGPWLAEFARAAPDREIVRAPAGPDDPTIRYALVWKPPPGLMSRLPNLAAIFSLGAGVDHVIDDTTLPDVPIVRIVADDLTNRMSEYVVWQVLDHLRQGRLYRAWQARRQWREAPQPAAGDVTVGIMGLGALGTDAAGKLAMLGFRLAGWSRRPKHLAGIACHSGEDGLAPFLGTSDILVVLLPLTAQTRGIINRRTLALMKRETPLGGPVLINAGRGGLQVEADIVEALDNGALMAASLDVFETEPLPATSPLWDHPAVTVTPHAAATSDPRRLVPIMARQMDDFEAGRPLANLVDRKAGY